MHLVSVFTQEKNKNHRVCQSCQQGKYAETVKYAGSERSGRSLKEQTKQTPSVSTGSPRQHYLIRPSYDIPVSKGLPVSAPLSSLFPCSLTWFWLGSWNPGEEFKPVTVYSRSSTRCCMCVRDAGFGHGGAGERLIYSTLIFLQV